MVISNSQLQLDYALGSWRGEARRAPPGASNLLEIWVPAVCRTISWVTGVGRVGWGHKDPLTSLSNCPWSWKQEAPRPLRSKTETGNAGRGGEVREGENLEQTKFYQAHNNCGVNQWLVHSQERVAVEGNKTGVFLLLLDNPGRLLKTASQKKAKGLDCADVLMVRANWTDWLITLMFFYGGWGESVCL